MSNYRYYNRNPLRLHLKDCVCRAISTATNLQYDAVDNLLTLVANDNECDKLCVCCYHFLLSDTLNYHCVYCDFNSTVSEIAEEYPNNKLIIRVDGHLTCSVNGVIQDIWDCSDELVDCYWIVS